MPEPGDIGEIRVPEPKNGKLNTLRNIVRIVLSGRRITALERAGALTDPETFYENARRVRVIAHKAGAGEAPEGTTLAVENAILHGADEIDIDVRMTRSESDNQAGTLVISHSSTTGGIDPSSKIKGDIADISLADFKSLDAGYNFSSDGRNFPFRGQGLKALTLEEALTAFPTVKFAIHLLGQDSGIEQELVRMIERHEAFDRVVVSGFSDKQLKLAKELSGGRLKRGAGVEETLNIINAINTGQTPDSVPFDELSPGGEYNPFAKSKADRMLSKFTDFLRRERFADPIYIEACRKLGIPFKIWTVNDRQEMLFWITMGVDAIYTDFPEVLDGLKRELTEQLKPDKAEDILQTTIETYSELTREFAKSIIDGLGNFYLSYTAAKSLRRQNIPVTTDGIAGEVRGMMKTVNSGQEGYLEILNLLQKTAETFSNMSNGDFPPEIEEAVIQATESINWNTRKVAKVTV